MALATMPPLRKRYAVRSEVVAAGKLPSNHDLDPLRLARGGLDCLPLLGRQRGEDRGDPFLCPWRVGDAQRGVLIRGADGGTVALLERPGGLPALERGDPEAFLPYRRRGSNRASAWGYRLSRLLLRLGA
jgi:hypothetical protein